MQVNGPLVARRINTVAAFLGLRDVPSLAAESLAALGIGRADVLLLVGGSPLVGADVLAQAIRDRLAVTSLIAGDRGHSTPTLRRHVSWELGSPQDESLSEAELFDAYLRHRYRVHADLLESSSTHTGANVANALDLLDRHGRRHDNLVVINDALMQRRVDAAFRCRSGARVVNFAAYRVDVVVRDGHLAYERPVRGIWSMEHYFSLLLGEIVRLRDDDRGYGPRGRGFIAHVDIPEEVLEAHAQLAAQFPQLVRGVEGPAPGG